MFISIGKDEREFDFTQLKKKKKKSYPTVEGQERSAEL